MAVHTYWMKDRRVGEIFFHVSFARIVPLNVLNVSRIVLFVLGNTHVMLQITYEMNVPTACKEDLYFQKMDTVSRKVGEKS